MSVRYSRVALFAAFNCALFLSATAASAQQSFLNGPPPLPTSPVRNNYTGFVGMKITTGGAPLFVNQLARYFLPGSTGSHTVKLVNAQTGVDVPNGSVVCTPPSAQGGYGITSLPAAVTLNNLSSYYVVSQETAGGDSWYDFASVSFNAFDGTSLPAAVYQDNSGQYIPVPNSAGESYVPVNFYFSTTFNQTGVSITSPVEDSVVAGASTPLSAMVTPGTGASIVSVQFQLSDSRANFVNYGPLLTQPPYTLQLPTAGLSPGLHYVQAVVKDSTGFTATGLSDFFGPGASLLLTNFSPYNPRNNFTGYVGLEFTVGSQPITLTALGRSALPGDYGVHTFKVINTQTGVDLTGGNDSIGLTPGDGSYYFEYESLQPQNFIPLAANTTYLFLCQETAGGDPWYDYGPVAGVAPGITINGSIYSSGASYVLVPNSANTSFGALNFKYYTTGSSSATTSVTITSPASNGTYLSGNPITFAANAVPGAGLSILNLQFLLDGTLYGPPLTAPPYTTQVDSTTLAGSVHNVVAVATDSGVNVADSPQVTFTVANSSTPTSVAITSPAPNAALSGTVVVALSVTVAKPLSFTAQLQLDGAAVAGPGATTVFSLDTTKFANGAHILTAVVNDSAGGQASSAPVNITINNATSAPPGATPLITSFQPSSLRNNYSGFVGQSFEVLVMPIQVSSLGRICVAGNSGSHVVKLVQAANGSDLPGGSVTVSLSGCTAGTFVYAALPSAVTLASYTTYYLVDQETVGGDQWYDYTQVAESSAVSGNGPVYFDGRQFVTITPQAYSYVPVNFLYSTSGAGSNPTLAVTASYSSQLKAIVGQLTTSAPSTMVQPKIDGYPYGTPATFGPLPSGLPYFSYGIGLSTLLSTGPHTLVAVAQDSLGNTATSASSTVSFDPAPGSPTIGAPVDVISFSGTTLRNNYSGFVGFRFTTGSSLLFGTGAFSIGRLCVPGNSQLHSLQIRSTSDGSVVAGAALNMSGCAAGTVVSSEPVLTGLSANTSYYLLSQEVQGGDQWYDISPATPIPSIPPSGTAPFGYKLQTIGANFTIDGAVYTDGAGAAVLVPGANASYVGLSIGGYPFICDTSGGQCTGYH